MFYLSCDWFVPYTIHICREIVQRPSGVIVALDPRKFQDGTENQLIQSNLCIELATLYTYIGKPSHCNALTQYIYEWS